MRRDGNQKKVGVVLMCLTRSVILTGTCQCACWVLFALDLVHADVLRFDALLESLHVKVLDTACSVSHEDALFLQISQT